MTHNRIFKNLVSTSQKTTRLLYREKPFGKKKVVHNKNSTKPVSTLSGQFAKVLKLMRILRIVESSGVPRGVGGFTPLPLRNSEDIGGVLDRMSKKNQHLDFLLQFTVFSYGCNL